MISLIVIYLISILISCVSINIWHAYAYGVEGIGLFDMHSDLGFVYLCGPLGALLLLVVIFVELIIIRPFKYLRETYNAPKWLSKLNPKIS